MSSLILPNSLRSGFIESSKTDEVAICMGLGVALVSGAECRNEYTKANGRPTAVFTLNGSSDTWRQYEKETSNPKPLPASTIRRAYNSDGDVCRELDDLVAQIKDDELRLRIQNRLPLAYASYGRAFMEARDVCMGYVRDALDFVRGRTRSGRPYLAGAKAKEFARRIGAE